MTPEHRTIEWGRASRGRLWHLLTAEVAGQTQGTFCEIDRVMVEVTQGLPPRGGTPCPRCIEVVEALTFACLQAQAQRSPRTDTAGPTLDTDTGHGLESDVSGERSPTP